MTYCFRGSVCSRMRKAKTMYGSKLRKTIVIGSVNVNTPTVNHVTTELIKAVARAMTNATARRIHLFLFMFLPHSLLSMFSPLLRLYGKLFDSLLSCIASRPFFTISNIKTLQKNQSYCSVLVRKELHGKLKARRDYLR